MKHPLLATCILIGLFLATQILGLFVVQLAIPVSISEQGAIVVTPPQTIVGPPPEVSASGALIMIIFGVGLGTAVILLLIRLRSFKVWKVWFTIAAMISMMITFGVLFTSTYYWLAAILAIVLAIWKVFYTNSIIHNFTEICIYPGIAVLFYDILSLEVMLVLLMLISIYDVIAVFKSKHMVDMAQFQTQSNIFAGLAVPRTANESAATSSEKTHAQVSALIAPKKSSAPTKDEQKNVKKQSVVPRPAGRSMAVLGGGDVAFPLLFGAVVLKGLIVSGTAPLAALGYTSIISIGAAAALTGLFIAAQKGKFYPAMPAVSGGALIGWGIILLLT